MPEQFKIGDRIKIIDKTFLFQNKEIGNGKLVSIASSSPGWISCAFENGYHNAYPKSGLELLPLDELKVGDKVRISVPRDHPYWEDDEKECIVSGVSHFFDDYKLTKDLYVVNISGKEKRFTREELDMI